MKYNFYTGIQFFIILGIFIGIWFLGLGWKFSVILSGVFFVIVSLLLDIRGLLLNGEKAKKELFGK